jgi:hypothetical protein
MKKILSVLLITFIFIISAVPANADSMIAPMSYEIEFEEQDLVFRMVPDENFESNLSVSEKSGLYVKSTGDKIYTVHEYFYEGNLYFSADRLSFIAMTWQETDEDRGIIFYDDTTVQDDGIVVMSYIPVTDLIKDSNAKHYTASHYFWEVSEKRVYDEKNSTLSILTNDGIRYTFDIKSGEIIQTVDEKGNNFLHLTWKTALILLIILVIGAAVLYYIMKKR